MIDKRSALLQLKGQRDIKCDVPGFKGVHPDTGEVRGSDGLEPHQRVGVSFGVVAEKCLILDFVGAGKTWEAMAIDLKHRARGLVHRTLVVCQGNKVTDWKDEYSQQTDLPVTVVRGKNKTERTGCWMAGQAQCGVTVVNYEAMRGDLMQKVDGMKGKWAYEPSAFLSYLRYDYIVFDEISVAKNHESVLSQAARALVGQNPGSFRVGLDATPVQNNLEDIYSIMELIEPGLLGSRHDFEENYLIKQLFERYSGRRPQRYTKVVGYQNVESLTYIIAPYFIRREKQDVYGEDKLKHVPKEIKVVLGGEQLKKYKELSASVHDNSGRQSMLEVFGKMEQVCDSMAYFDPNNHESAKLDDLRFQLTGPLKDEKVVIFSRRKLPLKEIETQLLIPEGIKYIRYTGDEDKDAREVAKKRFMTEPDVMVALVTEAAERGMNLHAAHYMIFFNHIYNPARTQQIMGRIDRPLVQKSNFYCTMHYMAKDTFEENTIPRFWKRANLNKQLFGGTNIYDKYLLGTENDSLIEKLDANQLLSLIRTGHLRVEQDEFSGR